MGSLPGWVLILFALLIIGLLASIIAKLDQIAALLRDQARR